MSKRSAEAETADGIPDEPKEKTAKLGAIDETTPLLQADAEAIKHAEEPEVNNEEDENANEVHENGQAPIIDEPDDESENLGDEPQEDDGEIEVHEEGVEDPLVDDVGGDGEGEEEEEVKIVKSGGSPTELPEDVKDVEFKVPTLPLKVSEPTIAAAASAPKAKDEENGSTPS